MTKTLVQNQRKFGEASTTTTVSAGQNSVFLLLQKKGQSEESGLPCNRGGDFE